MHGASGRARAWVTPLCFARSPTTGAGPADQMTGWLCRAGAHRWWMAAAQIRCAAWCRAGTIPRCLNRVQVFRIPGIRGPVPRLRRQSMAAEDRAGGRPGRRRFGGLPGIRRPSGSSGRQAVCRAVAGQGGRSGVPGGMPGSADDRCGIPEVDALVGSMRLGRRPHLQSRRPACGRADDSDSSSDPAGPRLRARRASRSVPPAAPPHGRSGACGGLPVTWAGTGSWAPGARGWRWARWRCSR
jgi:hypothetical protein